MSPTPTFPYVFFNGEAGLELRVGELFRCEAEEKDDAQNIQDEPDESYPVGSQHHDAGEYTVNTAAELKSSPTYNEMLPPTRGPDGRLRIPSSQMSAEEKKAVSERMTVYWAERRKAERRKKAAK